MVDINTTQSAQAHYGVDPLTGNPVAPGQTRAANSYATTQLPVGTSATLVIAARANRNGVTITNITGTQPSYYGPTAAVSAANGQFMPGTVGANITLPYSGAVYGVSVTAAQTVSTGETYG